MNTSFVKPINTYREIQNTLSIYNTVSWHSIKLNYSYIVNTELRNAFESGRVIYYNVDSGIVKYNFYDTDYIYYFSKV